VTKPSFVLVVDEERCKGCGLCIQFCPAHVLALSRRLNHLGYHPVEVVQPENCTGCQACITMCPDVCLELYRCRPLPSEVGAQ
jgi:2-oxoglutarate ferredoxin oxidoreductase subunit delta